MKITGTVFLEKHQVEALLSEYFEEEFQERREAIIREMGELRESIDLLKRQKAEVKAERDEMKAGNRRVRAVLKELEGGDPGRWSWVPKFLNR